MEKASVTQALSILKEKGLILQNRYGPVELTEKGRAYAEAVKYRHEILLEFLTKVLKLDRATAERDACLMEHAVSTQTINTLAEYLLKSRHLKGEVEEYSN